MSKLNELRAEIDQLHLQMLPLIRRRFAISREIAKLKINESIQFVDIARENEIIHRFDADISDSKERTAVQNLFREILVQSKVLMNGEK